MCHSRGVITSPLLPETIKHTSLQEKWPRLGACFAKGCLAYKSIAVILSIHKHTSILMHAHTQCLMCTRQHLTNRTARALTAERKRSSRAHEEEEISITAVTSCCVNGRGELFTPTRAAKKIN